MGSSSRVKHGPHRGDLEGVRRQPLAADLAAVVVLLVDLDLVGQPGHVGHVDLDRPVAEGLHELVGLKLLVLRLVGVTDDHLVDVGLGELLGLDLVFLAGTEQVVEEGDVELEDLDEFDDAAVGDVELAVEIEGAGIALGAVLRDLAIVDVAGQLGGVLVLLVLGLEGADADAILLGEDQPAHADVLDDARPVAAVAFHPLVEHLAAERAEVAFDRDLEVVGTAALVQERRHLGAMLLRDQVQRLLVHRAVGEDLLAVGAFLLPAEAVEASLVDARIALQPLLEQPRQRALGAADRPVQEQDAPLRSVAVGGALEDVDQVDQGPFQAEDGVLAVVFRVLEELVADQLLLVDHDLLGAVADDHVVDPLVGRAGHLGIALDDVEILGRTSRSSVFSGSRPGSGDWRSG